MSASLIFVLLFPLRRRVCRRLVGVGCVEIVGKKSMIRKGFLPRRCEVEA